MMVPPSGPSPARVMIVGEAPGADEVARGQPFVGASGYELDKMLGEAGISRAECFITNVARERPPGNDIDLFFMQAKKDYSPAKHTLVRNEYVTREIIEGLGLLEKEIDRVKPKVILALGNTALWALTGRWGIKKWRGSQLTNDIATHKAVVIPSFHPAAILRQWDWRAIGVNDLRRVRRFRDGAVNKKPDWKFIVRPSYDQVIHTLEWLERSLDAGSVTRISFDIETRAGHIACAGVSWSLTDGLCIPFMCIERREGFWEMEQEFQIILRLGKVLQHPLVKVVGQNIIYDAQYTWRHWKFVPRVYQDTMIAQHSIFSAQPKGLDYLASMYCNYYVYWKDESKDWAPGVGEDQLWIYNCQDCVYTDEAGVVLEATADKLGLRAVYDFQQRMFWPVLRAMQLGVRVDHARRIALILEVKTEIDRRKAFLLDALGHPLNPDSPKQMKALFYDDFKMPIQMKRGVKGAPSKPTLNDEALVKIAIIEPLLKPLLNAISDIRTLSKFLSNFLERGLDDDGRFRSAFNIGGSSTGKSAPVTFRLSSSENAFGGGGNLQNIPSEKSKSVGKAIARAKGSISFLGDPYQFPNIREIFIPDPGYTWFDMDLERADLFVVCWEAGDELLKTAMRLGVDIHLLNAFVMSGKEPPDMLELVESHPKYPDHKGPMKHAREFAKTFCHGTNYGGGPRTMAGHTGRTIHEIDRAQKIWFGAHPGIKTWHERVQKQVMSRRYVENKFGNRWYIFDRPDGILPEAIAWIPQSTVSVVINKIWENIHREAPEIQVLMQVHDSLPGQFPTELHDYCIGRLQELSKILIPYEDPLVIPTKISTSTRSWGHCQ